MFFSTSQAGTAGPRLVNPSRRQGRQRPRRRSDTDVLISCQGGDYTTEIYPRLRAAGWNGYWIDAASTLRMKDDAVIVLDPVNRDVIDRALDAGVTDFIGGNCTVSLMLMAMAGLFRAGLVEWVTRDDVSGGVRRGRPAHARAGVADGRRAWCGGVAARRPGLRDPRHRSHRHRHAAQRALPTEQFGHPLAGSLLPWIDKDLGNGQSKEEWKAIGRSQQDPRTRARADSGRGLCVRIGAMRCHSQALTMKLTRDVPLGEIERCSAPRTSGCGSCRTSAKTRWRS